LEKDAFSCGKKREGKEESHRFVMDLLLSVVVLQLISYFTISPQSEKHIDKPTQVEEIHFPHNLSE
jgi:hypothetical protein